jgi:hypothetical protein
VIGTLHADTLQEKLPWYSWVAGAIGPHGERCVRQRQLCFQICLSSRIFRNPQIHTHRVVIPRAGGNPRLGSTFPVEVTTPRSALLQRFLKTRVLLSLHSSFRVSTRLCLWVVIPPVMAPRMVPGVLCDTQ